MLNIEPCRLIHSMHALNCKRKKGGYIPPQKHPCTQEDNIKNSG